jgi:hypothetical protein
MFVSFRRAGYCWRIQSQPRKFFKFGRIKRISSLSGEFANSIRLAESSQKKSEQERFAVLARFNLGETLLFISAFLSSLF